MGILAIKGKRNIFLRALALTIILAGLLLPKIALATLLPEGFFDRLPRANKGQVSLAADFLSQTSSGLIIAYGQVDISYQGYYASADRIEFDQISSDLTLIGNVVIRSPDNIEYAADRVELTGKFKKAILNSMIMITPDGALITAEKTLHDQESKTILQKGTYAPCGNCVDSKGRKIGWRVRTKTIIYDKNNELIDLEQPILEILGVPIAWLPWLRLPDPSNPRTNGFRMPSYFYSEDIGLKLEFPYFYAAGKNTDIILVPSISFLQGPLLSATIEHRFSDLGKVNLTASGLYQFNRSIFAGKEGDRDWRGAIQTYGEFTPIEDWKFGWSYTTFSDAAFLTDYNIPIQRSATNEIYAEYLSKEKYANIRVQDYVLLGNYNQVAQNMQANAVPNIQYEQIFDLADNNGTITLSGNILGVNRLADSSKNINGVPYIFGYQGNKIHANFAASWKKQIITTNGLSLTPYLALRADGSYYDGASSLNPTAVQTFSLTPIAAIDLRYPLIARNDNGSSFLFEPIAQLVYRGSDNTKLGINNDNAQNFIFDETNLFSFNRFSGTDRQETGLRANIGARYLANFDNGSFFSLIGGQSIMLSGLNSFAISDETQIGTSTKLGSTYSNIVIGAEASFADNGFRAGAKASINPNNLQIDRGAIVASLAKEGWELNADYTYLAPDPLLGTLTEQHDIGGSIRVPFGEYWYAKLGAGWNIRTNSFIDHRAIIGYDDGYFALETSYGASGGPLNPTNQTYKVTFKLKGPDGTGYGF